MKNKKKATKKKVTNRNGYAKALESPTHQQKIIPNKKRKAKNNPKIEIEYEDFADKLLKMLMKNS